MQCDGTDIEGNMAVNFRNRVENCTDNDVGNYENLITYRPEDFATPSLIRKSLMGDTFFRAFRPITKRSATVHDF